MKSGEGFFVRVVEANGARPRGGYAGGRSKRRPYGTWVLVRARIGELVDVAALLEETVDVLAHLMFPEGPVVAALFAPIV